MALVSETHCAFKYFQKKPINFFGNSLGVREFFKYFLPFIVFAGLILFFIIASKKRIMMFCGGGIMELLKKRVAANHSVFGSRLVRELWLFVIFIDWVYLLGKG
jgi:hypothetical protein